MYGYSHQDIEEGGHRNISQTKSNDLSVSILVLVRVRISCLRFRQRVSRRYEMGPTAVNRATPPLFFDTAPVRSLAVEHRDQTFKHRSVRWLRKIPYTGPPGKPDRFSIFHFKLRTRVVHNEQGWSNKIYSYEFCFRKGVSRRNGMVSTAINRVTSLIVTIQHRSIHPSIHWSIDP